MLKSIHTGWKSDELHGLGNAREILFSDTDSMPDLVNVSESEDLYLHPQIQLVPRTLKEVLHPWTTKK